MFNFKKYFTDEFLQVALILSLLRIDRRSLEYNVPAIGIGTNNLTSSWEQSNVLVQRERSVHPKSIDSLLLDYEQEVFHELNSLGRYTSIFNSRDLTAYLLSVEEPSQTAIDNVEGTTSSESSASSNAHEDVGTFHQKSIDSEQMSQEDLDVIETLWKYDVNVDEFLEEVSALRNKESVSQPDDEPIPPDGSSSITPEITSPTEDVIPNNATFTVESESPSEVSSEVTNPTEDIPNGSKFTAESESPSEVSSEVTSSTEDIPSSSEFAAESESPSEVQSIKEGHIEKNNEVPSDQLSDSDPWLGASSSHTWFSGQEDFRAEDLVHDIDDDFLATIKNEVDDNNDVDSPAIFGPEFSLEATLQLFDLNEEDRHPIDSWSLPVKTEPDKENSEEAKTKEEEEESKEDPGIEADFFDDETLEFLTNMIHAPAPFQYHHSRPFQNRSISPYVRTMGVDHRWHQDFGPVMNFSDTSLASPYHNIPHYQAVTAAAAAATSNYSPSMAAAYPSHHVQIGPSADALNSRNALVPNAGLPGSMSDPNNLPYSGLNNSCSVGATVANSMNLANNSVAETVISSDNSAAPAFKIEPSHQEAVYPYQNSCTEMNHTTDGFLTSILNDDDFQAMDMAMSGGIYPMRMDHGCNLTQNGTERGTDSDSAVSSMGSERSVPSMSSDTEWMESNSDSGQNPGDHYPSEYPPGKYRWFDSYPCGTPRGVAVGESSPNVSSSRQSQQQSKKYHFYGRRSFHDQNTSHQVMHNHTYHVPPEAMNGATGTIQKPAFRDKMKSKSGRKSEDEQLTRDEKRARQLSIPIGVCEIINLPMDEFNERISKFDLTEHQLTLIKDIRRRGKNKVAAQNCRKRKLDQITSLEEEVKDMKDRKYKLLHEREYLLHDKQEVHSKYIQLYRHIMSKLRDHERQEFQLYESSVAQSNNGCVLPLEMDPHSSGYNSRTTKNKDRKP